MLEYKHYFIITLCILFIKIKNDRWYGLVNGYSIIDHNYGYAGDSTAKCVDLYLCGKKKYRVHYLGDDKNTWSKNFSNCDPAGIGREIDGLCIYSNRRSYKARIYATNDWTPVIKDCDINDHELGYAGELGNTLSSISINGDDYYRFGYIKEKDPIISSYNKNVSDRIIKLFFGEKIENKVENITEYELDLSLDKKNSNKLSYLEATIQLLKNEELNLNGDKIKYVFYTTTDTHRSIYGNTINNSTIKKLKDIINFDYNEEIIKFHQEMATNIMRGIITIHSNYKEKRIQFDVGSKVMENVNGFRDGIRLNFILKNDNNFIELIKKTIKCFVGYLKINERKIVMDKLKDLNDMSKLDEIMKLISPYDLLVTQIIVLYIKIS